jgi:hypothetical protein
MKMNTREWVRLKISQQSVKAITMVMMLVLLSASTGCDDSTDPENSGEINMTTKYSSFDSPSGSFGKMISTEISAASGAIDSLRITRARFVIRDIKYKTQSDSSNFRAAPFVLELNLLSTMQEISVAEVPFGTYRRIEFDVHRVNTNDVTPLPASEQGQFQEFLAGERYSIIISGTTYTGGQPLAFTFRSRVNVKQKIDLSPELLLGASAPAVNATMLISSSGWFRSSSGGLLDPNDPQNENTISDNFRASIKVFKDNNKDGSKDAN